MPATSNDGRIQERLAQLQVIVERRNELLSELFRVLRTKQEANLISYDSENEDEDEEDLEAFLAKYDIEKDPEKGSISRLDNDDSEADQTVPTPSLANSPPQAQHGRTTRSRSIVDTTTSSSPTRDRTRGDSAVDARTQAPLSPSSRRSSSAAIYVSAAEDSDEEGPLAGPSGITKEGQLGPAIASTSAPLPSSPQAQPSTSYPPPVATTSKPMGASVSHERDAEDSMQVDEDVVSGIPILEPDHGPTAVEIRKSLSSASVTGPAMSAGVVADEDASMDMEPESDDILEVSKTVMPSMLEQPTPSKPPAPDAPKYIPIHIPLPPSIHEDILIPTPTPAQFEDEFQIGAAGELTFETVANADEVDGDGFNFNPQYTLPPLSILPPDFIRKSKPPKKSKKDSKKEKDDTVPMGIYKWAATLHVNPVWKKVSRSTKVLSSREWGVAITELRLIRVLERIEALKQAAAWSFRQPKKQRNLGGNVKSHWDYLMDEMKWMRTDFREERRWKMAVAYSLATAVKEWHWAKTPERRIEAGICVKWKPSRLTDRAGPLQASMSMDVDEEQDAKTPSAVVTQSKTLKISSSSASLLGLNYGSDDEDDDEDEQTTGQGDIYDPLDPANVLEDALQETQEVKPKDEEVDDPAAMDLVRQMPEPEAGDTPDIKDSDTFEDALKASSNNPMLIDVKSSTQSTNGDAENPTTPAAKLSKTDLVPLQQQIAFSDDNTLFVDLPKDFQVALAAGDDLSGFATLFPELRPFEMLDVAPPVPLTDSKKKSDKNDPNKRLEDTMYTKMYPASRFMHTKPTLLGPMQPVTRWKDGQWAPLEVVPVSPDPESSGRMPGESSSELFEVRTASNPPGGPGMSHPGLRREDRKRASTEALWTANDDALLKSLTDKYFDKHGTNWALVAECFNSSRLATSTDKRTPAECQERFKEKFSLVDRRLVGVEAALAGTEDASAAGSSQMTTRQVRQRLASGSVSGATAQQGNTAENKRRRRHVLLQESIRKANKKRQETAARAASTRKGAIVHETHNQYNKLPKYTPQELSRRKAEQDQRNTQELMLARKRQDEALRQSLLQLQQQQQQHLQQQQQQQQQQQAQQGQQAGPSQAQPQAPGQAQVQATTPVPAQATPATVLTLAQQSHALALAQQQQQAMVQAQHAALAAGRNTRLSAGARQYTPQQQAQLLAQARAQALPLQLQAGTSNLSQTLLAQNGVGAAVGTAGRPTGANAPFYAVPNLSPEQYELFHVQLLQQAQAAQQQAQVALQQQQQQQQAQQQQQQANQPPVNGFNGQS